MADSGTETNGEPNDEPDESRFFQNAPGAKGRQDRTNIVIQSHVGGSAEREAHERIVSLELQVAEVQRDRARLTARLLDSFSIKKKKKNVLTGIRTHSHCALSPRATPSWTKNTSHAITMAFYHRVICNMRTV